MPHKDPATRLAYQRAYRENNPTWAAKHREYQRGYMTAYREKHPTHAATVSARWRARHPDWRPPQVQVVEVTAAPAKRRTLWLEACIAIEDGLVSTRDALGRQRMSGAREDAEQNRVLRQLEAAARKATR